MDIVYLRELKIPCTIGVWDWERRIKQIVVIDLDMATDVRAAARTDRLEDALDYKAVTKRLIEYVGNSEYQLVETLAEHVAEIIRTEFKAPWVRVRINKKGAIRGAADVGVVIERGEGA
ncbi:MAG: dihydroneopterin aldolase [Gammaproteobacteria bacterium]|nr:MAG: dihydroneopterin aldolase [Gammaproteobacteria bacterium]